MADKEMAKQKYRKAVFVITYRKEKDKILYLLLKRKLHWRGWEFPKGGIKKNESLIKAVKREIKEETGQKAHNVKSHNISGKYKYDKIFPDRNSVIGQTYKLFSAEIKDKKIGIDRLEHSSYKWLPYAKALKMLTYKNQKKCLKYADKTIKWQKE